MNGVEWWMDVCLDDYVICMLWDFSTQALAKGPDLIHSSYYVDFMDLTLGPPVDLFDASW